MAPMRAPLRSILTASLLLTFAGCGGGKKDAVEAVCDLLFSCDCSPNKYADVDACIADANTQLTAQDDGNKSIATQYGLTFDQACVDASRQVDADLGCDLENAFDDSKCVACAVVHGDQPLGAGCTISDEDRGYSNCARNLTCYNGLCADPCQRLAAGDDCAGGASLARCADGLFCDEGNTKQCQPEGGVGSPCPTGVGCKEDLFCGTDLTCQAPPKAGEPCGPQNQCAEELFCTGMTCETIPGEGEPCTVLCQDHFLCEASVCISGPAIGEPCPENGPCGPGAQCDNNGELCIAEQPFVCSLGQTED